MFAEIFYLSKTGKQIRRSFTNQEGLANAIMWCVANNRDFQVQFSEQ